MRIPAWEDAGARFPRNLVESWWESLVAPGSFFKGVARGSGLARPVLYFLLLTAVGAFFTFSWSAAYDAVVPGFPAFDRLFPSDEAERAAAFLRLSLAPFVGLARLFLWSVVLHAFVTLLTSGHASLGATFRAVAYASGPAVFRALPFIGGAASAAGTLVLVAVGIREAHGVRTGSAVAALALSILVPAALVAVFTALLAVGLLVGLT